MKKLVVKVGFDITDAIAELFRPNLTRNSPDYIIYFNSKRQFNRMLPQKRLELLRYLSAHKGKSVGEICRALGRKKEAISRDLHELSRLGFLKIKKRGKNAYPFVEYGIIQIELLAANA